MGIKSIFQYIAEHEDLRCIIIAVWLSLIVMAVFYRKIRKRYAGIFPFSYHKTEYYKQTGYALMDVVIDTGKTGEYLTYRQLKRAAPEGSRYMFNLYLPCGNSTTEIDMLLITKKGIFVVESKNYTGKITGRQDSDTWKEHFKKRRDAYSFYNPIKQNATHVSVLKAILERKDIPLFSLVVFSDNARLSRKTTKPCTNLVITRNEVLRTLRKTLNKHPPVISQDEVNDVYQSLTRYTMASKSVQEAHIRRITEEYGS